MASSDKITLRDIYDIADRLETKFDSSIKEMREEFSSRIRSLEERQARTETIITRVLAIASVFSGFLTLGINWLWKRIVGE